MLNLKKKNNLTSLLVTYVLSSCIDMHTRAFKNKQNATNRTNNQSTVEQASFDSRLLLLCGPVRVVQY